MEELKNYKELMNRNPSEFTSAPGFYRMKSIIHAWPEDPARLLDALEAFGYGGAATNPSFENGYTSNPKNLEQFGDLIRQIWDRGMDYWIYDENGYPSGYAGGKTLENHPEYEAKGFYMVRRIAYEPKTVKFHLDDESDRIIWAAKYPLDCRAMNASIVLYDKMTPVPFSEDACSCRLEKEEVLFIFCVKSAYEGTHCVHNVCSHSRYINILNKDAVRHFLDVNYEPIVRAVPDAYEKAQAVFTDEPSLMTGYIHGDETWPWALAPWTEGLFEAFEEEYGFSIYPYLPMIFEGRSSSYGIRIKFYELVGKMIAEAYTEQIGEWCRSHGTVFSGHYLAEESLQAHVTYYGSYLKVLEAAGYPGVDILASYPDIYLYNTPKFAQMAARKSGADGIMVELCPFIELEHFRKDPVLYARGILNLMIQSGCRSINSYFSPDFASYDPIKLGAYGGYMNEKEAKALNEYVGRIFYMLEGVQNQTGVFVYYGIEEAQAKMRPSHCALEAESSAVDRSIRTITTELYQNGIDYLFCDREDLSAAAASLDGGQSAQISGLSVQTVIIPAMDIIYAESYQALVKLKESGVTVLFADKLPRFRAEEKLPFAFYDFREEADLHSDLLRDDTFTALKKEEMQKAIAKAEKSKPICRCDSVGTGLLTTEYERDQQKFYFAINNTEQDMEVRCQEIEDTEQEMELWDPENGEIRRVYSKEKWILKAYQGIFLVPSRNSERNSER